MIVAIIPAYNEEDTIIEVVNKTLECVDYVLLIDDGSTDNTSKIVKNNKKVKVIRHLKNLGVGSAMKSGISYVKRFHPDVVVTLDADGQHSPHYIKKIVKPIIDNEADLVLGSRFLETSPTMPILNSFGNKVLTRIINILTCNNLTDAQTGFRSLSKDALKNLTLSGRKTYVHEMIIDLTLKGYKIKEIGIETNSRKHGTSKVTRNILSYIFFSVVIIIRSYLRALFTIKKGC